MRARDWSDGGAPGAEDVAHAFKLRKRGLASRKRSKPASKPRGSDPPSSASFTAR